MPSLSRALVRWPAVAIAISLVTIVLLACTSASDDPAPTVTTVPGAGPCTDSTGRSTCGEGRACGTLYVNGNAIPSCLETCGPAAGKDCAAGEVCYPITGSPGHGWCRPACTSDGDCRSGLGCHGGRCVCTSGEACGRAFVGDGQRENPFQCGADGFCVQTCATSSDCVCDATCRGGRCANGCASDADCCGSGTCHDGTCVRGAPGRAGDPCLTSDDCTAGTSCSGSFDRPRCMPVASDFCSSPTACPSGYECIGGQTAAATSATCLPRCDLEGGGCGDAEVCRPVPTRPTEGACLGACNSAHPCAAGSHCDAGSCICDSDVACTPFGPNAKCSTGACTCTPSCDGKECGPDGCGGSCGACDDVHTCAGGECVGSCGTNNAYVSCGGDAICPPQSKCNGSSCVCDPGTYAVTCNGRACGSNCTWEYRCTPCQCAAGQTCDGQGQCITPGNTGGAGSGGGSGGGSSGGGSSGSGTSCPSGYPVYCGSFCCPQNTICCANDTCGLGRCPSGGSSSSSGGGGSGHTCQSANSCVSTYTMTNGCNGYIGLRNDCGKQVSCNYTLSNGQSGCALPQPGSSSCGTNGIYAPGLTGTLNCELTDKYECLQAIGCSL